MAGGHITRKAGTSRRRSVSFAGSGSSLSRLGRLGLYGSPSLSISGPTPFNPTQISGLVLFYDPSDPSTVTLNGGNVALLANKLGDGRDLPQPTVGLQPVYDPVGLNGLGTITCEGKWLGNTTAFGITPPAGYTYIGLASPTNWTLTPSRGRFFAIGNSNGDTGAGGFNPLFRQDGNPRFATGTLANQLFNDVSEGAWFSVTGVRSSTTVDGWFNGTKKTQITGVTALSIGIARATLGVDPTTAFSFGTNFGYGKYGPQLVYNRVLTDDEIAKLQGWIHWRYGLQALLPLAHPYKNRAPTAEPTFYPTSLTGLVGWWEADSVVSAASLVSQVNDKSGLSNHLLQPTGANQPTLLAADLNGWPTLSFADAHYLIKEDAAWVFSGGASSFLIFYADSLSGSNDRAATLAKAGTADSTTDGFYILVIRPGGAATFGPGSTSAIASHGLLSNQWVSIDGIRGAASTVSYLNGLDRVESIGTVTPIAALPRISLGVGLAAAGPSATYVVGKWALSLLYNRPMAEDEMRKLQGWAHWRYGLQSLLPGSHPYKNAPP